MISKRYSHVFVAIVLAGSAGGAFAKVPVADHYYVDDRPIHSMSLAFGDTAAGIFDKALRAVTNESPAAVNFGRGNFRYAGPAPVFVPALFDLLAGAVAKGDRWPLETFVNGVNARRLAIVWVDTAAGGLFDVQLSIAPPTATATNLHLYIDGVRSGGTTNIVSIPFAAVAPSMRGVRIPGPATRSVIFEAEWPPASALPPPPGRTKKTETTAVRTEERLRQLAPLVRRAEQIDRMAETSGLLDDALVGAGGFPFVLGTAPAVTNFPGFPAEDPCNQSVWTLPIVTWSTSHYAFVHNGAVAHSTSPAKRPPAPPLTPAGIENYQKTVYKVMESLRLMCGATTGELAQTFTALWAPYLDQPNAEAFEYFTKLSPLLNRYWEVHAKIEADLEAARQSWQQAGVAAGLLDEDGTRAALDNGFMIAQRLKKHREDVAKTMKDIAALGDPPNPLQSKCNARGRHQAAMEAVAPSPSSSSGGCWVMTEAAHTNFFSGRINLDVKDTSMVYEKPLAGYKYDYNMLWSHPPGRLAPGQMIELPFQSVRTGLDTVSRDAILDVPRLFRPAITGVVAFLTQIRYPSEDYFHFVLKGSVSTYQEKDAARLEIRLWPYAGVNRQRQEPYENEMADWQGLRRYVYEWDPTGKKVPFNPGPSAAGTVTGLPTAVEAPPPAPTPPPAHTSPEVAAAVAEHQQYIAIIRRNLQRAQEELARERDPDRRRRLEDEVVMHLSNIQEEEGRIESLRTGQTVRVRTVWEERTQQRFLEKIREEVNLLAAESKWVAGLPKLARHVTGDAYGTREKIHQDMQAVYGAGLSLEERVARLRQIGASVQSKIEGEQKGAFERLQVAEDRLWYAEKVQTAANIGIMAGALFVPGAGFVAMGYGFGSGWAEGGPAKAAENTIRAISPAVDVLWAGYEGYYAQEMDPATGKLRYRGWWGAAENAAITYVMNKVFDKLGESIQGSPGAPDVPGMGQTGAVKGSRGAGKGPVKPEPRIDAFEENTARFKDDLAKMNKFFEGWYPKDANGKVDTSHPNYPKVREMHQKATARVEADYGVIAKRENLKSDLAASTKKHEARIPAEARNPDGTVNTKHPEYQRVKGEWEADMKAIRERHNEGFEARWNEQQSILDAHGLKDTVTPSGGKPKSIMSDIDLTAKDMESGKKFIQGMKDKGHKVLEYGDRWVIPGTDTTIWKPNARPERVGSAAHSASADYFTSRGSDKFPTEGGVAYTTGNAAGVEDPAGAVISNLKKATEAGIGGNTTDPDYHIIGKSCDKAAEIANKYDSSKPVQDPAFFDKAKGVREHKTPEEAGIMTFGNPQDAKSGESRQFLEQAQGHMRNAMKAGEAASQKLNAQSLQSIDNLEAAGDRKAANRIREMLVRARVSNEAAMQSLGRQDPSFISKVHSSLLTVTPPPPPPPPPGQKFGYGWLMENTRRLNAEPIPDGAGAGPTPADTMKAAAQAIEKEALPVLKKDAPERAYFASLKGSFDAGEKNPVYAARAVRAASGYEMSKVAADVMSLGSRKKKGGGGAGIANPLAPPFAVTNAPPLENRDLAGAAALWAFYIIPVNVVEVGPLGTSNMKRRENELAPRQVFHSSEIRWTSSTLKQSMKRDEENWKSDVTLNLAADAKGERLALVQFDDNTLTAHQESWSTARVRDLPLVEKKVFGGNPKFYALVYRAKGDALRPLLELYEYGFNSSWDVGRWKGRSGKIRWEDMKDKPSFTVIFGSVHPSAFDDAVRKKIITPAQRAEFESWIENQKGWKPIPIPQK